MSALPIDTPRMLDFLVGLLNTPSPTGYGKEALAYLKTAFEALNIPELTVTSNPKGALIVTWQGERNDAPIGVTAHADTLGLMVKEIKPNGRLKATNLGGIMWAGIEFEGVTIRTQDDRRYRGTVVPNNASIHVNMNLAKQDRNAEMMEIRIDAVTQNADQTRALGIEVGDIIFVDPRVEITDAGFVRSRFLDDKAGVAAVYGAIIALHDAGKRPSQTTTFVITNYEEVGHGGAAGGGLPVDLVELLTIDMGAVSDGQNSDEYSVSLCVKDTGGAYHYAMNDKLRALAAQHDIPLKPDIYPGYSSDGTAFWRAGGSARVGLIGPGIDASHSYERTHQDSISHTAHLIAQYLLAPVEA